MAEVFLPSVVQSYPALWAALVRHPALEPLFHPYGCDHSDCKNILSLSVDRCIECGQNYCKKCWKTVEPHKSSRSTKKHIPYSPRLVDHLDGILRGPKRNQEQQNELDQQDSRNLWFGVVEDAGDQYIREGPVYEDLIFENPAV